MSSRHRKVQAILSCYVPIVQHGLCPWVTQPVPGRGAAGDAACARVMPWVTQPVPVGDAACARVVPVGDAARARVWQLKQMTELQQEQGSAAGPGDDGAGPEWCQQQLQRLQERQRHPPEPGQLGE